MQRLFLIIATCLLLPAITLGQSRKQLDPITGVSFRFNIDQVSQVIWVDSETRPSFQRLSNAAKVPIWIDRRCDPSAKINLAGPKTLRESLWLAGEQTGLDVAWVPEVVVVAPHKEANRWATINVAHRRMLKKLPAKQRSKWLRQRPWRWPRLTNPQDLLSRIEKELGAPIRGRETVLHDLWPAADFPALPLYLRLELLLLGYSKTFSFEGKSAIIRAFPESPRISLPLPSQKHDEIDALLKNHPTAELSSDNRLLASWRTHEFMRLSLETRTYGSSNGKQPPVRSPKLRYTYEAKDQPVGPFITQLAKQLQLSIEFTEAAAEKKEQRVSFSVDEAKLEQLIEEILRPAGLTFRLKRDQLKVLAIDEARN